MYDFIEKLQKLKTIVETKCQRMAILKEQTDSVESEIKQMASNKLNYEKSAAFCDILIEKLNQSSIEDIENLVSEALEFIFNKPYKFKMNLTVKRGNPTYRFSLWLNGNEEENLLDAQGGGIISVISILMRIVTILTAKKPMKRFLLLDESLGMLSSEYVEAACIFIKDLGNKLGFTIVLISHEDEFTQHADVVYRVEEGVVKCEKN